MGKLRRRARPPADRIRESRNKVAERLDVSFSAAKVMVPNLSAADPTTTTTSNLQLVPSFVLDLCARPARKVFQGLARRQGGQSEQPLKGLLGAGVYKSALTLTRLSRSLAHLYTRIYMEIYKSRLESPSVGPTDHRRPSVRPTHRPLSSEEQGGGETDYYTLLDGDTTHFDLLALHPLSLSGSIEILGHKQRSPKLSASIFQRIPHFPSLLKSRGEAKIEICPSRRWLFKQESDFLPSFLLAHEGRINASVTVAKLQKHVFLLSPTGEHIPLLSTSTIDLCTQPDQCLEPIKISRRSTKVLCRGQSRRRRRRRVKGERGMRQSEEEEEEEE